MALTPDETILGLLAHRPSHGYELLTAFQDPQQLGKVWNLSTSQVYAVLNRLSRQGLVSGQEITSESGPPRTVYMLTERGRQHLHDWLYEKAPSPSIRDVRVEFLSRLHVARMLELPTGPIIDHQETVCRQQREDLQVSLDAQLPGTGQQALRLVAAQLDALLVWIDTCRAAGPEQPQAQPAHASPKEP